MPQGKGKKSGLEEVVDPEIALVITSWLTSFATTWLRSASRGCRELFLRNVPAASSGYLYLESRESPVCLEALENLNMHSPLKCWRLKAKIASCLFLSEKYVRLAKDLFLDRNFVETIVAQNGMLLCYASEFQNDRDIVLTAVSQNWSAVRFAHENLFSDKAFGLALVAKNGYALRSLDISLKKDKDVVLRAVTRHGQSLEYADSKLKRDQDVVFAAVKCNGHSLHFADDSLKKNRHFILRTVAIEGYTLDYAHPDLRNDRDFVLEAVSKNYFALQYVHPSLQAYKCVKAKAYLSFDINNNNSRLCCCR